MSPMGGVEGAVSRLCIRRCGALLCEDWSLVGAVHPWSRAGVTCLAPRTHVQYVRATGCS